MRISDWSSDVCSSDLIDGSKAGVAEFLVRIAIDLHRQNVTPLALTYARLSTFLAPENSETWLVTSELLAAREQRQEALEVLTHVAPADPFAEIGRASCRERVCPYVESSVVAVSLNKKNSRQDKDNS